MRIDAGYYSALLASDLEEFAEYHAQMLLAKKQNWDAEFFTRSEHPWECLGTLRELDNTMDPLLVRLYAVADAWALVTNGRETQSPDAETIGHQDMLQKARQEYGRRYVAQQQLLGSGQFIQELVARLANMPTAQSLQIVNDREDICLGERASHDHLLFRSLITARKLLTSACNLKGTFLGWRLVFELFVGSS